jgi:hypothetical protein
VERVEVLLGDAREQGEFVVKSVLSASSLAVSFTTVIGRRPWLARANHRGPAVSLGELREGELGHRRSWAMAYAGLPWPVWVRKREERGLGR